MYKYSTRQRSCGGMDRYFGSIHSPTLAPTGPAFKVDRTRSKISHIAYIQEPAHTEIAILRLRTYVTTYQAVSRVDGSSLGNHSGSLSATKAM